MKCIIQVDESGNYVNHPITIDNFIQAFDAYEPDRPTIIDPEEQTS
jgi:hypothetical protein